MAPLSTLVGAATFAILASCLSVVSPSSGSELDLSGTTKVEWLSSDDDPSSFNFYLLNKDRMPSVNLKIASNLSTSDNEYTFDGVDVLPGSGYVFNFKDVSSNNILAQSDEFTVVSHGDNTTTSTATSTATSTPSSSNSSDGASSSIDASSGGAARSARLPMARGMVAAVVGIMYALWGDI